MLKPGQLVSTFSTQKGKKINIRVVDKDDAQKLMDFINPVFIEDTYLLRSPEDFVKNLKEEQKFVKEQLQKIKKQDGIQFLALYNDRIIGNVDLRRLPYRSKHLGEIGIAISKGFREEGIGQELIKLIEHEAKSIGLKGITLTCFACNERAVHVYEKCGLKKTGVLPKAYSYKGKYEDGLIMYKEL